MTEYEISWRFDAKESKRLADAWSLPEHRRAMEKRLLSKRLHGEGNAAFLTLTPEAIAFDMGLARVTIGVSYTTLVGTETVDGTFSISSSAGTPDVAIHDALAGIEEAYAVHVAATKRLRTIEVSVKGLDHVSGH